MGSLDKANTSLPVIDLSPFLVGDDPISPIDHPTVLALRSALHDYGFFYLSNHSLDKSLTDQVLSLARQFFRDATSDQKAALKRRNVGDGVGDGARGYQLIGENVSAGQRDWHEALDWYAPIVNGEGLTDADLNDEKNWKENATRKPPYALLDGLNLWPSYPEVFRATYEMYINECRRLGEVVLRVMGYALELQDPEFFVKAVQDSFWVMRAIGYPPLDEELAETGGVSCGEHTDYGCLTLLLDDGTPDALQVWMESDQHPGGKWVSVQPREGCLVINIGDMVELWTGGKVKSTKHRVVHKGKGFRVSVPFFLEPGKDIVVSCLDEFKPQLGEVASTKANTNIFTKVKYGDHLARKVGGNFYSPGI